MRKAKKIEIPLQETLSKMIEEINKYSNHEEITVHCLFCRA